MIVKKQRLAVFVLTLLFGIFLSQAAPPTHAQGDDLWTFIYYSAADNDLEPFMIGDLIEMQAVGSSDQVNIVVQIDRAEGYDAVSGDWTDTRRFLIEAARSGASSGDFAISPEAFVNNLRGLDLDVLGISQADLESEIDSLSGLSPEEFDQFVLSVFGAPPPANATLYGLQQTALATVGETNGGDPDTLVDFATWAVEQYPAQNYALIISNHGGGWLGVAFDEDSDDDMLTMPEIDQALAEIRQQTGIEKFTLIGFDACLMSQLEVLKVLAKHADYAITSQETIPGAGWEYVTPLLALTENPSLSIAELGQQVVDSYMDYYTNVLVGYKAFDLHLFDLSKTDAVLSALDDFSVAVQANPQDNLKPIGQARANAQLFGADDPSSAEIYSSVDLVDFMNLLNQLTTDQAVKTAAQAVIAAVDAFEVYGSASPGLPKAHGVAIYFPRNIASYSIDSNDEKYAEQADMDSWTAFLATFHGTAVETFAPDALTIDIQSVLPSGDVASIYDPPVVIFETNGEGIVDMQFFASLQLEDNLQIILDQAPLEFVVETPEGDVINEYPEGQSDNEFAWNVEMPQFTDGQNTVIGLLVSPPDSEDEVLVEGLYRFKNGGEADSFLVFDVDTRTFQSAWGIQSGQGGQAIGEIFPQRGDSFEPYWTFLDEDGDVQYDLSGTQLYFGGTPITYTFVPAESGSYVFTMWVEDMAGNVSFDHVEFTVDNEGLDGAYRGFKDIQTGINFLFPWDWDDPTVIEYEAGSYSLVTEDESGDVSMTVTDYPIDDNEDLETYIDFVIIGLEEAGITDYEDPKLLTLDGFDAAAITYNYEDEDGDARTGIQVAVFVDATGTAFTIDIEGSAENADVVSEVFEIMAETIIFFEQYEF